MNKVFKALSDPTRRQILRLLSDGEKNAGELAAQFDLTAPSMSHHFNVLRKAGLVSQRREGQQLFYRLEATVFQETVAAILDLAGLAQPHPAPKSTNPEQP